MPCPNRAARLALAFVGLGLLARLLRYALGFPLWGDEASLALNLSHRDYRGLTEELDHYQVAPLLFLWLEKAALTWLGDSEWALRLLPFLAGTAALFLFWRLARDWFPPLAAALATAFLAVARWPVTMSANLKPYSLDLLVSLVLLTLASSWLRHRRARSLLLLTLGAPLAVGLSYPAVFVAGGISLVLLPAVWQRHQRREWALFTLFHVLLLAAFLATLCFIAPPRPGAADLRRFMADYWRAGFPPDSAWQLPLWLASAHTGQMFAYPAGAERGGSALTLALFGLGAAWCWRHRPRWLLGLCLTPFALTLLAACLHRYPYGVSARLAQHLAPAICLLAGAGLARLAEARPRTLALAVGLFVVCGVAGMAMDLARPYRDPLARWSGELARDLRPRLARGERLVVRQSPDEVVPTLRWHLERLGPGVTWGGQGHGDWSLDFRRDDGGPVPDGTEVLASGKERFRCTLYPPRDTSSRVSQRRNIASR